MALFVDEGYGRVAAVDVFEQLHDQNHLDAVKGELFVANRDAPA